MYAAADDQAHSPQRVDREAAVFTYDPAIEMPRLLSRFERRIFRKAVTRLGDRQRGRKVSQSHQLKVVGSQ